MGADRVLTGVGSRIEGMRGRVTKAGKVTLTFDLANPPLWPGAIAMMPCRVCGTVHVVGINIVSFTCADCDRGDKGEKKK